MELAIIAAVSENNVIGKDGKIPWHIKEDIDRFKRLTLEHPVIMGRITYELLPERFRPLPQRKNIVLSNTLESREGIYIAKNIREALNLTDDLDSYVIGGSKIYRLFLHLTNKIELTRVHRNFEGDAFFPEINLNEWVLKNRLYNVSKEGISYSFLSYLRR